MTPEPVTLLNTGLPLLVLGAAGLGLPWLLIPAGTRSLRAAALTLLACVPLLTLAGMAVFGLAMAAGGTDVAGALAEAPFGTLAVLGRSSAPGALVWGPALILAGLSIAQRIEARRGADRARREP